VPNNNIINGLIQNVDDIKSNSFTNKNQYNAIENLS
jgi:hypothetical protein